MNDTQTILMLVVEKIRSTINEDWILDYSIESDTRFNDDLEIESIEFIKITNAIQDHYGAQLKINEWFASKNIHELINLTVGQLVDYINSALTHHQ